MAEKSSWWRSLTVRKKANATSRDSEAVHHQECGQEAPPAGPEKPAAPSGPKPPADSKENKMSKYLRDEYEDSYMEPVFNEKTCRRNLRISRSGRFKEKRRIRATLPENNNFYEGNHVANKEGFR
ncbi:proline-rich protein 15 [Scleropages formosus]|uniref:proline-rich protein 15 n=1 Tax=Scleropages formosus TaxID=113540 RepID=UPI0006319726|nr:proline-rich protein 15 [Scleropages formosus]